jgi:Lon protease-like protein
MTAAETARFDLPLFPLGTVLFPGGRLPLQIFEPRYLDLVSRCMREGSSFGVVLIRAGSDIRVGLRSKQPEVFDIGSEAKIVDFNQLSSGRLGITIEGGRKFRVHDTWEQSDGLLIGEVAILPEEPELAVSEDHQELVDLLNELTLHPEVAKLQLNIELDDARCVGWRLSELLPIEPEIKQSLLQLPYPRERLQELRRLITKLRG